jgi:hypothetical protein
MPTLLHILPFNTFTFSYVCYLITLSVTRLHSVDDKMINGYGAIGEMSIGGEN